jgi:hypothetical protein
MRSSISSHGVVLQCRPSETPFRRDESKRHTFTILRLNLSTKNSNTKLSLREIWLYGSRIEATTCLLRGVHCGFGGRGTIGPRASPSFFVAGTNVARARCQREPTNAANRSALSFSIVFGTLVFVIPVQLMYVGFRVFSFDSHL